MCSSPPFSLVKYSSFFFCCDMAMLRNTCFSCSALWLRSFLPTSKSYKTKAPIIINKINHHDIIGNFESNLQGRSLTVNLNIPAFLFPTLLVLKMPTRMCYIILALLTIKISLMFIKKQFQTSQLILANKRCFLYILMPCFFDMKYQNIFCPATFLHLQHRPGRFS